MISFESSWKVTNLKVVLAQEEVVAGQYVCGNVQFEVKAEMPFRRVYIDIFAQEDIVYHFNTKSRRVPTQEITLLGRHATDEHTLVPGTYDLPFAVQIPIDAALTIRDSTSMFRASLTYQAAAVFDVPFATLLSDTQAITDFAVIAPTTTLIPARTTMVHSITTNLICGCFSAGYVSSRLAIANTVLELDGLKDTPLVASITVDNTDSSIHIDHLTVSIRRVIVLHLAGRGGEVSEEGVVDGTVVTPVSRMIAHHRIHADIEPGEGERQYTVNVSLPPALSPSYRGSTFSQSYELVVDANDDGQSLLGTLPLDIIAGVRGDSPAALFLEEQKNVLELSKAQLLFIATDEETLLSNPKE